jgi:hypothetical protein
MANTIKLRRSATAGSVPTTGQLALGELAMNTADGKLFMKTDVSGTESIVEIGSGGGSITIANAPPAAVDSDPGDIYWDEDDGSAYIYYDDGTGDPQWVPLTPLAETLIPGANAFKFDDISGTFNGVLTDFTININSVAHQPAYENATLISLGGVIQQPGTDYTISGSTLTFTTAPAAGLDFFGIDLASPVPIGIPSDGTITPSMLEDDFSAATGGGTDAIFFINEQTVTTSYSIPSNRNAFTAGPISVNSGAVVTIPSGSTWVIV